MTRQEFDNGVEDMIAGGGADTEDIRRLATELGEHDTQLGALMNAAADALAACETHVKATYGGASAG